MATSKINGPGLFSNDKNIKKRLKEIEPKEIQGKVKYSLGCNNENTRKNDILQRKSYQLKVIKDIHEFENAYCERMKKYTDIKEENDNFATKFKQTEKIEELCKQKKLKNVKKSDETFHELIFKYRTRGYKIPDLISKHNLFKPSPLLLENHKIEDFYQYLDKQNPKDNSTIFLMKMNLNLNERIQIDDPDSLAMSKKISKRNSLEKLGNLKPNLLFVNKTEQNLANEIEDTIKYNNEIRNLIINKNEDSFNGKNDISYSEHSTGNRIINNSLEKNNLILEQSDKILNKLTHLINEKDKSRNLNSNKSENESEKTILNFIHKSQDSNFTKGKVSTLDNSKSMSELLNIENVEKNIIKKNTKEPFNKKSFVTFKNLKSGVYDKGFRSIIKQSTTFKNFSKLNENKIEPNSKTSVSVLLSPAISFSEIQRLSLQQKHSEREKILSHAYETINQHNDQINLKEIATNYAKKFWGYDDKTIEDALNKKIEPVGILKAISELKSKIDLYNVPERFRLHYTGYNNSEYGVEALNKISVLDKQISKMEFELTRKLNKISKG